MKAGDAVYFDQGWNHSKGKAQGENCTVVSASAADVASPPHAEEWAAHDYQADAWVAPDASQADEWAALDTSQAGEWAGPVNPAIASTAQVDEWPTSPGGYAADIRGRGRRGPRLQEA